MRRFLILVILTCTLSACGSTTYTSSTTIETKSEEKTAQVLETASEEKITDDEENRLDTPTEDTSDQNTEQTLEIIPVNYSSIDHLNDIIAYYNAITPDEQIKEDNVTETIKEDEVEAEINLDGFIFRYSPTSSCVFYTCEENVPFTDENMKPFLDKAWYFVKASFPAMTDADIDNVMSELLLQTTPSKSVKFDPSEEQQLEVYRLNFDFEDNNGCFFQYYDADYYYNMSSGSGMSNDSSVDSSNNSSDDLSNFNYMFPDY